MTVSQDQQSSRRIRLIGQCDRTIWGLSPLERMIRIGRRFGITDVKAWAPGEEAAAEGLTLVLRTDTIIEDRIVPALFKRAPTVLHRGTQAVPGPVVAACVDGEHLSRAGALVEGTAKEAVPADWVSLTADAHELSYNEFLRKRAVPFVLNIDVTPVHEIEQRMFGASYKGATDFVTKWLWPRPALRATRWCAARGISPNQVTALSAIFVLMAMWMFWIGQFGLGLVFAWAMTFLDTVDGKLARVTVTSSKWGNVFDHGIDMVHPPFWYWAWWNALGMMNREAGPLEGILGLDASFAVIVAGYVAGRLLEGAFIALFKFEMHVWKPFDFWFRAVTARRNPNLAILLVAVIAGVPAEGFVAVALWTIAGLIVHGVRLIQAVVARSRGAAVESFLSEPAPAAA
ncbi:MAG: CDP-alcohol phosphatidyltransferase family protein [Rhodobacteraceae bacterium]|nr:CDP-alcohol phosphatidyltransferase family protein [Paracoccaceae bacterium]